jgi:hypothetical protein
MPPAQSSGWFPLHRWSPGEQFPWQEAVVPFETQVVAAAQGLCAPQAPMDVQTCSPFPAHCAAPGAQVPTHFAFTHALFMQTVTFAHFDTVPSARQAIEPGAQKPVATAPPSGAVSQLSGCPG